MFTWATDLIERLGALGVAFLMFLETVFPPIPSELIMPLAGFSAARGDATLVGVLLAGIVGSLVGAVLWYEVGRRVGGERIRHFAARHGRWLTLAPQEIDQAEAWFHRRGRWAVLIGRLVPGIRSLISVPAGVAKMPFGQFLLYSTLGTAVWTALLTGAGYLLEDQYTRVGAWMNPVSNVVIVSLVGWYLWRVATFSRRTAATQ